MINMLVGISLSRCEVKMGALNVMALPFLTRALELSLLNPRESGNDLRHHRL